MEPDIITPSWKLSLPHVVVATTISFLFGYHIGFVLFFTFFVNVLFLLVSFSLAQDRNNVVQGC